MAKKKQIAEKNNVYSANLTYFGKKYNGIGDTVIEAIASIPVTNCKGKTILVINKGEEKKEKILTAPQSFRLFSSSKLMREIALKQVSQLFNI